MTCGCGSLVPPSKLPVPSNINSLCCPVICAQPTTEGDVQQTVPEFDLAVADLQLVHMTVTGYVTRTDNNNGGAQEGFIYMRVVARRNDADAAFAGLAVLANDFTLQVVPAGIGILPIVSGNTLQVQIDGDTGTWYWDLQMNYCIRDVTVHVVVA